MKVRNPSAHFLHFLGIGVGVRHSLEYFILFVFVPLGWYSNLGSLAFQIKSKVTSLPDKAIRKSENYFSISTDTSEVVTQYRKRATENFEALY
jgi:hypothetical protein